jgi:hypothetical protein
LTIRKLQPSLVIEIFYWPILTAAKKRRCATIVYAGIPTPVESGELDQQLVEPLPGIIVRAMRIFGGIALFIGISLILLIVWAEVSGYR